ncbi:hypothetical protein [Sphingomonas immobilis]|uniref:Uncharacterized protein n=1 Tax=Sphingomonas immobilis TaxID=3063997 RepID=A0ABT9A3W3_9SPHN|nr:hypothetical protein [Sphingomonas sp. CA1-15]MDO7843651.1 hypothetical protein [Sphingomonas sp. CA1-15]
MSDDPSTDLVTTDPAALPRIADVGWLLDSGEAQFLWDAPRRVRTFERNRDHAKAVNNCPAYLDYESRLFEVPCPIDLRLRIQKDAQGRVGIMNPDGDKSGVRMSHLNKLFVVSPPNEWRHPNRPIVQFVTPYVFVADEAVWVTQLPPVQHFNPAPWPGLLIGGRFPTHIWPRTMMWAFEWWDMGRELVLKRGEPWFYVNFEPAEPSRPVRLSEAELTPELAEYRKGMSGVTNYVNQTYALFRIAEERRPPRLFKPRQRGAVDDRIDEN